MYQEVAIPQPGTKPMLQCSAMLQQCGYIHMCSPDPILFGFLLPFDILPASELQHVKDHVVEAWALFLRRILNNLSICVA